MANQFPGSAPAYGTPAGGPPLANEMQGAPAPPRPQKRKTWLVVAALALAFVLVGGTVLLFVANRPSAGDFAQNVGAAQQRGFRYYLVQGAEGDPPVAKAVLADGTQLVYPENAVSLGLSNEGATLFYLDAQPDETLHLVEQTVDGGKTNVVYENMTGVLQYSSLYNALLFLQKQTPAAATFSIYSYYEGQVKELAQNAETVYATGNLARSALYRREGRLHAAGFLAPEWAVNANPDEYEAAYISETGKTVYLVQADEATEPGDHRQPLVLTILTSDGTKRQLSITAATSDLFGTGAWKLNLDLNAEGDEAVVSCVEGIWHYNGTTIEPIAEGMECVFVPSSDAYASAWGKHCKLRCYPQAGFEQFYYYTKEKHGPLFLYEQNKAPLPVGQHFVHVPQSSPDLRYVFGGQNGKYVQVEKTKDGFVNTTIGLGEENFPSLILLDEGNRALFESYHSETGHAIGGYSYFEWREEELNTVLEGAQYLKYSDDAKTMAYLVDFEEEAWCGTAYVVDAAGARVLLSEQCALIWRVCNDGSVYFMEGVDPESSDGYDKTGTMYRYFEGHIEAVDDNATVG